MSVESALPDPSAALFPTREVRTRLDDWLSRELPESLARVARGPVTPTLNVMRLRAELATFDFNQPRQIESLLAWTIDRLEHGTVHMTHPRYFGLFNPAPNFPSQCADRIAGAFNPQLASSGSSPAPVEIEAHVIRAFASRAGLPADSGGHFTTSGSEANFTALLCALTRAAPAFIEQGVRSFAGPPAIYASRDCHSAWFKIVQQAGLGRNALHLIATDGAGKLDTQALERTIARDLAAGCVPVMICATAGSTNAGMVDPLARCAEISHANGLWFHVDAAWGGAALSSPQLRATLAGIESADSITIDAHKWLATTMGCGMLITRYTQVLGAVFAVAADFMPSNAAALDPYLTTLQWSRRFMGLRLFLTLATAGWSGVAAHIERSVQVTDRIRKQLLDSGWQVVNDSALAVLCVEPPAGVASIRQITQRLLTGGRAWVAATRFEGREVIRICVTHGESTQADVDELVRALNDHP